MNCRFRALSAILLSSALFLAACEQDDQLVAPGFDIDLMVQELEQRLDGQTMGYSFSVALDGNHYASRSQGYARHPADTPLDPVNGVAMDEFRRINVASVSKFVGAVALMEALQDNGIDADTPIHNHLPPSWKPLVHGDHFDGGSIYRISFRNLLRMETGIQFAGTNWSPGSMPSNSSLLAALQLPADPSRWGKYQNGNFCLIRVLIGEIVFDLDEQMAEYDQNCAEKYIQYINDRLFMPIGIASVSGAYVDTYPPMSYEGPSLVGHSTDSCTGYYGLAAGDGTLTNSGSGGLRLSSLELANFLAYFMHSPATMGIQNGTQDEILDGYLGLTSTPSYENPEHGDTPYYSKAGAFTAYDNTCVLPGRAHRSCVMIFEETGVEVGLITNSPFSVCDVIADAYDAAWH